MKRNVLALICVLLFSSINCFAQILKSGSFEDTGAATGKITNWEVKDSQGHTLQYSYSTSESYDESQSLKIEVTTYDSDKHWNGGLRQTVTLEPNTAYQISYWAKAEADVAGNDLTFFISENKGSPLNNVVTDAQDDVTTSWKKFSMLYTTDVSQTDSYFEVRFRRTGTFYVDRVAIVKTTDATLEDLRVDGITVSDFTPSTDTYNVELPAFTKIVPTVTADDWSLNTSNVKVTAATELPGASTVEITAPDGTTKKTYTINFTLGDPNLVNNPSFENGTDADSELKAEDASSGEWYYFIKEGVAENTTVYNYETSGSQEGSKHLGVNVSNLVAVPNSYVQQKIFGLEANTKYIFSFWAKAGAGNVDGSGDFTPAYYGNGLVTPNYPQLDLTTTWTEYQYELMTDDDAGELYISFRGRKAFEFFVDNVSIKKYIDVTLSDLKVNSTTIEDFSSSTTTYDVELPAGTEVVPTVVGTLTDNKSTVEVTAAETLPGTTTIKVTGLDDETTQTYSINFTVAEYNPNLVNNPSFESGIVADSEIKAGNVDSEEWYYFEKSGVTANTITYTYETSGSQEGSRHLGVNVSNFVDVPNSYIEQKVIDLEGNTKYVYSFWAKAGAGNVDGSVDFTPGYYGNALTGDFPQLDLTTTWTKYTYEFTTDDDGGIIFISFRGRKAFEFFVDNVSIRKYVDTTLSDLKVNSTTVEGFSSSTTTYDVELPAGTEVVPTVVATLTDDKSKVEVTTAGSLPGTTTVKVTGLDQETTQTYSINFTVAEYNPNLVSNPSFESGTNADSEVKAASEELGEWYYFEKDGVAANTTTYTYETNSSQEGSRHLGVNVSNFVAVPNSYIQQKVIDLEANTKYIYSFWAKAGAGNVDGSVDFTPGYYGAALNPSSGYFPQLDLTTTWTEYNYELTTDADGGILFISFRGRKAFEFFVDNVSIKKYVDTTLSDLKVSGTTITDFSSEVTSYDVELPAGTKVAPTVVGIPTDNSANVEVTAAASIPGTTVVKVTGLDNETIQTYNIHFTAPPTPEELIPVYIENFENRATGAELNNNGFTLWHSGKGGSLKVQEDAASAYEGNKYAKTGSVQGGDYVRYVDLEAGKKYFWSVATKSNAPEGWERNHYLMVKVGNTHTYKAQDDPLLNNADWTVHTTEFTAVAGQTSAVGFIVSRWAGYPLDIDNFYIYERIDATSNATLTNIKINGETVTDFAQTRGFYNIELPQGTVDVPTVTFTKANAKATAVLTDAGSVNGQTTIVVTGEDGVTKMTYTLNFTTLSDANVWSGTWSEGSTPVAGENVLINTNYKGNGFTCDNLTIAAGQAVEIGDGSLNIKGDIVNNGTLLIKSGASLVTYEGKTFTGNNVTVERNTRYSNGQYSFVGTVVEENTKNKGRALGKSVYKYNETIPYGVDEGLDRWIKASKDVLVPGKGYTQAYKQKLSFVGKPNNGTIIYKGTYTTDAANPDAEGWNLVANPYPTAINAFEFLKANIPANGGNTAGSIYIWDDNGSDVERGSNDDYIVINGTGVTGDSRRGQAMGGNGNKDRLRFDGGHVVLGAAQGFFVQLIDNSNLNITFDESMRRTGMNGDNNFFRQAVDSKQLLRLSIQSADKVLYGETLVGFLENATEGVDAMYDAKRFSSKGLQIYSLIESKPFAIQGLPYFTGEKMISLGLDVAEAGSYTFNIAEMNNLPENAIIELIDTQLNIIHNLSENGTYTFDTDETVNDTRFVLNIKERQIISSIDNTLSELKVKVLPNEIQLFGGAKYNVQIMDMAGKMLLKKQLKNTARLPFQFNKGKMYIVNVNGQVKKVIF